MGRHTGRACSGLKRTGADQVSDGKPTSGGSSEEGAGVPDDVPNRDKTALAPRDMRNRLRRPRAASSRSLAETQRGTENRMRRRIACQSPRVTCSFANSRAPSRTLGARFARPGPGLNSRRARRPNRRTKPKPSPRGEVDPCRSATANERDGMGRFAVNRREAECSDNTCAGDNDGRRSGAGEDN
ncbi:hypothetical protein AAFF_G00341660 [Aldrovandia affinis]|uniref:Uncharacterized protein n=1 Tax=Aldrovandia affinis TaxID=143900 RepID=A0AAD7SKY2_9TELE|nr:hypothetical protein AAFF_G00341660 [Aldrovandia affinis]